MELLTRFGSNVFGAPQCSPSRKRKLEDGAACSQPKRWKAETVATAVADATVAASMDVEVADSGAPWHCAAPQHSAAPWHSAPAEWAQWAAAADGAATAIDDGECMAMDAAPFDPASWGIYCAAAMEPATNCEAPRFHVDRCARLAPDCYQF